MGFTVGHDETIGCQKGSGQEGKKIKLTVCLCVCVSVCVCKWNSYIDIQRANAIWRIFINMDANNGWTSLMDSDIMDAINVWRALIDGITGRH